MSRSTLPEAELLELDEEERLEPDDKPFELGLELLELGLELLGGAWLELDEWPALDGLLLDSPTNSEEDDESCGGEAAELDEGCCGGVVELDEGCGGGGGAVLELDELNERLEVVLLVMTLLGDGCALLELDVALACEELLGKGGAPEVD